MGTPETCNLSVQLQGQLDQEIEHHFIRLIFDQQWLLIFFAASFRISAPPRGRFLFYTLATLRRSVSRKKLVA